MQGKVCLVTGANSGIGKVTALELAKRGAMVVMVCRDEAKGKEAQQEIISASGSKTVDLLIGDLASQQSIRTLVTMFKSKYPKLHVLINNAGMHSAERVLTKDNIEMTLAVNHLGPFLITNLLLDILKASAPARIINVASSAHSGSLNLNNLQGEQRYDGMAAYSQSKLENFLFTYELAKRLEGTGVTVNCLHPGVIKSGLQRDLPPVFQVVRLFFTTPEKGAETTLYLATSPDVEGVNGKYFVNKKIANSAPITHDATLSKELWDISEKLTALQTVGV